MSRRTFGTLRKLPSGRYQARYRTPDGQRITAPLTFANKTDAARYLITVEADIVRGTYRALRDADTTTVGEWVDRYLASRVNLKPSTMASYRGLQRQWIKPRIGELQLEKVTKTAVREWVADMTGAGLGASMSRKALVLLAGALDAAIDDELIEANPARGVKPPRLPMTEPHVLTREQADALIAALAERYRLPVQLLAYGGLRFGEMRALRRRSVDVARGRLYISESVSELSGQFYFGTPKSHQTREISLPQFLVRALTDHLMTVSAVPDALLFPTRSGGPLRDKTFRAAWSKAVIAAGLADVTPHDLRASCGSWVAERYGVMAAAQRLGHSSASVTTRHYARAVGGA